MRNARHFTISATTPKNDTEKDAVGSELLVTLGQKRRARLEEEVTKIDFTLSSRKAWSTINRLIGKSSTPKPSPVSAKSIATILVNNVRWLNRSPKAKKHPRSVKSEIKQLVTNTPSSSDLSHPFSIEELTNATKHLEYGQAPGPDRVHTEFLKNLGLNTAQWLTCFLSNCLEK